MKLTQALWRQHIGRMIKRHWWYQGRVVVINTPAEKHLIEKGIQVEDAKVVVSPPKIFESLNIEPFHPKPQPFDETHPNWHETPCLKYGNDNLLLEGVNQALLLTKTVHIDDGLPVKLPEVPGKDSSDDSTKLQKHIESIIKSSNIFDAHQEKLPKKIDPRRPEFNFPRILGITDVRKTHNLTRKFLQLCELLSDPILVHQRKMIYNGHIRTYIEKDEDLLYFESIFDTMVVSNKPLTAMTDATDVRVAEAPFPSIYPLLPTISLEKEHIYNSQEHYPVTANSQWVNPHTIFINYDAEKVKHITGLPISESEIVARSLLKSFATAVCCAKQKFGSDIKDLPEPIVVQCVQSNSKWFHFSVYQLNTLDINGDSGTRNIWWSAPQINLYERAEYVDGAPVLEGYNPEVFQKILAFYRNV